MADPTQIPTDNVPTNEAGDSDLVSWIMTKVQRWRSMRDTNYLEDWKKYYSIWRGEWNATLKNRDAERCRIITPATQQAIDEMVAEMSEATFGRSLWFDIEDNEDPKQQAAAEAARMALIKDFDRDGVPSTIRQTYVNGAIYGTGIAKRTVSELSDGTVSVGWEAIPPFNFVVDTSAKNIEEALGCAHETTRPLHEIEQKQASGEYINTPIGEMSGYSSSSISSFPTMANLEADPSDGVYITEYHGLVPLRLLNGKIDNAENPLAGQLAEGEASPEASDQDSDDGEYYIEAVVTIGNGGTLLKKVESFDGMRGVVAYQHDIVPNVFWGRGVAEKAFNSQAALDAEIRARIDALGLMTYPVMGADATRLPRNLNLKIVPGKTILTNGRPSEVIEPITFGNLDPVSFQHSGDLERMVQMATGSYSAASQMNIDPSRATSGGISMAISSMIKRAKMTMFNVDQNFLDPIIRKSISAYRTLNPERYPVDLEFQVHSAMSIMAKEFEQTQMTNLLAIIPPESPVHLRIVKAIIENYSGPSKDKLAQEIEAMLQPDPKKQQMEEMLQMIAISTAQAELMKVQKEAEKLDSEISLNKAKTMKEITLAKLEDDKVELDAARIVLEDRQTRVQEKQVQIQEKEVNMNGGKKSE